MSQPNASGCLGTPSAGDNKEDSSKERKYTNIFGTWNNPPECLDDLVVWLKSFPRCKFNMQEETGENGTPHLQFKIHFGQQLRLSQIRKYLGTAWFEGEPKKFKNNWDYCVKDRTRTGRRWEHNTPEKIHDPFDYSLIQPWQQEVLDLILETPHKRRIYWFWSNSGNIGKTTLAKHICIKYKHDAMLVGGKAADILKGVVDFKEAMGHAPKIIIWNIPRCNENHVSYQAIENAKDGIFFSGKYESAMCIFNTPHIIVFANEPPNKEKLSEDRWRICQID